MASLRKAALGVAGGNGLLTSLCHCAQSVLLLVDKHAHERVSMHHADRLGRCKLALGCIYWGSRRAFASHDASSAQICDARLAAWKRSFLQSAFLCADSALVGGAFAVAVADGFLRQASAAFERFLQMHLPRSDYRDVVVGPLVDHATGRRMMLTLVPGQHLLELPMDFGREPPNSKEPFLQIRVNIKSGEASWITNYRAVQVGTREKTRLMTLLANTLVAVFSSRVTHQVPVETSRSNGSFFISFLLLVARKWHRFRDVFDGHATVLCTHTPTSSKDEADAVRLPADRRERRRCQ